MHVVVAIVQLLSHVQLFVTPGTIACQVPLSPTISWSLLKLMSTESVMLSNHLILCSPLGINNGYCSPILFTLTIPNLSCCIRGLQNFQGYKNRKHRHRIFVFKFKAIVQVEDWICKNMQSNGNCFFPITYTYSTSLLPKKFM